MSCKKGHKWRQVKREEVGSYYHYSFTCRGCSATKSGRRLIVMSQSEEVEESSRPITLFTLLQVLMISLMISALVGRCGIFISSHIDQGRNLGPTETHTHRGQ